MAEKENKNPEVTMSKDEQIGFHKGALSTLAKEREEFTKVLGIVEQLIQMHVAELKKLGVDIAAEQAVAPEKPITKGSKKPIEDII